MPCDVIHVENVKAHVVTLDEKNFEKKIEKKDSNFFFKFV
jgi:hypothetical protein